MLRQNEINLRECQQNLQTSLIINQDFATKCVWIVTDGKAGDQNACIGIAHQLKLPFVLKNVLQAFDYKKVFSFVMSAEDVLNRQGAEFSAPFPDMIIASGRRAAPVMRAIKLLSPKTFCVFLKNPYTQYSSADVIWQPSHDKKIQPFAVTSILSPHHLHITPYTEKKTPDKIVGVLVGGNSKHAKWNKSKCAEFVNLLQLHAENEHITLKILTSRRTPQNLLNALQKLCKNARHKCYVPNSAAQNPYVDVLQQADAIIVTADSVNMLSESLARGCNVYIFEPKLKKGHVRNHVAALIAEKLVTPLSAHIEFGAQDALNVTPALAAYISNAYIEFQNNLKAQ